jgi:hypothetical protein
MLQSFHYNDSSLWERKPTPKLQRQTDNLLQEVDSSMGIEDLNEIMQSGNKRTY